MAKSFLAPLRITTGASAIDREIQKQKKKTKKKKRGSGTTTLAISNREMNEIMKIVQAPEDSNISSKRNI